MESCRDVNKCFVPTEFCKQLGRAMGLAEQQLVLHGLPIRPIFSKRLPSRKALRKQLVSIAAHCSAQASKQEERALLCRLLCRLAAASGC